MELENVHEVVHIDAVDVAVCEGSHVDNGLAQPRLLPARVSTDVIFAQERENLAVLDGLQGAGDNKDEVSDALPLPDDEVPRSAVSHPEVCGQGPETAVTGQPEGRVPVENSPE